MAQIPTLCSQGLGAGAWLICSHRIETDVSVPLPGIALDVLHLLDVGHRSRSDSPSRHVGRCYASERHHRRGVRWRSGLGF